MTLVIIVCGNGNKVLIAIDFTMHLFTIYLIYLFNIFISFNSFISFVFIVRYCLVHGFGLVRGLYLVNKNIDKQAKRLF